MRIEANDKLFIDSSLTYNSDYNSEVKFAGNGSELLIAGRIIGICDWKCQERKAHLMMASPAASSWHMQSCGNNGWLRA